MENRTDKQNAAMHLWFTQIAEALNEAGLDMRAVLKPSIEIDWTPVLVKEYLWRPVQKLVVQKQSTTELNKQTEINLIYETINRFLAQKGIHIDFPHYGE